MSHLAPVSSAFMKSICAFGWIVTGSRMHEVAPKSYADKAHNYSECTYRRHRG
jgi:hypothetical protein